MYVYVSGFFTISVFILSGLYCNNMLTNGKCAVSQNRNAYLYRLYGVK